MGNLKCRTLILKVASRCNLNCTYCYMYNAGDTTYRLQPKFMSEAVADATLARVQAHVRKHRLGHFRFVFHGGEPLLADPDFYRRFVREARRVLLPRTEPSFAMQTNGTLLTDAWCQVLGELGIGLGVSLDGPPAVHDKARRDHQGAGTYAAAVRGLHIARQSPHLPAPPGILCVIDPSSDPLEVYAHLRTLSAGSINFLLPYGTHDHPPPGVSPGSEATPYADWLLPIFDRWLAEKAPKPRIPIFGQLMELVVGIDRGFEYFGGRPLEFLVVETDGSLEAAGALKVCGHGFTKAGLNVLGHGLDQALDTELARLYHQSHRRLPGPCRRCPLATACGGGFLPHRYSRRHGFGNPSVLCLDLMKLITHVQNAMLARLPAPLLEAAGLVPARYEQVKNTRLPGITPKHPVYEQQ